MITPYNDVSLSKLLARFKPRNVEINVKIRNTERQSSHHSRTLSFANTDNERRMRNDNDMLDGKCDYNGPEPRHVSLVLDRTEPNK